MRERKLGALVVYADREHCANVAYLTGFDPRFEEALLLLSSGGRRKLLVGNECLGYLPDTRALGLEIELFQEFSLMGQPRNTSRPLKEIFRTSAWARLNVSGAPAGNILTHSYSREVRNRSMCQPILPTSCASW